MSGRITPRVGAVINTVGFGGVTTAVAELMRHLADRAVDQRLFVLKAGDGPVGARQARIDMFADAGVPVTIANRAAGKLAVIAELADWISTHRIDILHTHSYRPNLSGRIAGALMRPAGLALVAHYHNHYDDKWDVDPESLTLERHLAGTTDAMIAVSESVRLHVAQRVGVSPDRLDVVSNGVDLERFAPIEGSARTMHGVPTIGIVGRVCEQKGHEDLIEAVGLLRRRGRTVNVVCVGQIEDTGLHQRLNARSGELEVQDCVTWVGHRDDIADWYSSFDVLAAPSRWEGFGLMLVEAMACGVPIVATRVGAIPDVVGDVAALVGARQPAALADALDGLLGDPDRRAAAARAGRARAPMFAWPVAAERVNGIYDKLMRDRSVTA